MQPLPAEPNSEFSLTATDVLEYLYCPRFPYFESYLSIPEHQEKRFKVQTGRTVHEDKTRLNPGYLRKKLGVVERQKSVYLSSSQGIRGVVDEILFLQDGSAAPLDYKFAAYKERTFANHRYQLTFYGQLIQGNYPVPVTKGFIVYTRSRNKLVEVEITAAMYTELQDIIRALTAVLVKGRYPPPTKAKARCLDCCYRNICEKVI
jgi:CRISPR-associated exonuclease Cas4